MWHLPYRRPRFSYCDSWRLSFWILNLTLQRGPDFPFWRVRSLWSISCWASRNGGPPSLITYGKLWPGNLAFSELMGNKFNQNHPGFYAMQKTVLRHAPKIGRGATLNLLLPASKQRRKQETPIVSVTVTFLCEPAFSKGFTKHSCG